MAEGQTEYMFRSSWAFSDPLSNNNRVAVGFQQPQHLLLASGDAYGRNMDNNVGTSASFKANSGKIEMMDIEEEIDVCTVEVVTSGGDGTVGQMDTDDDPPPKRQKLDRPKGSGGYKGRNKRFDNDLKDHVHCCMKSESCTFIDLNMPIYKIEEPIFFYKSLRFKVFGKDWEVKVTTNFLMTELRYKLVLKSRSAKEMKVQYVALEYPYMLNKWNIEPYFHSQKFREMNCESNYELLATIKKSQYERITGLIPLRMRLVMYVTK